MRLIFIGFGTVGQGLADLLLGKKDYLAKKYGFEFVVTGISDINLGSLYDPGGINLGQAVKAVSEKGKLERSSGPVYEQDALRMIQDAEADVIVEATYTDIKTAEPATAHIRTALSKGMHVVTTNKGPLALHYHDLMRLAEDNNAKFLFEGTVMSGTPLLNLIRETLAGSNIEEIKGILNGTTNYILTQMEAGLSYETALSKAQELGYAEAVPDADVLGWDALAKVTILSKAVFGANKAPFDYPCEGITGISADAVAEAGRSKKRYKLIGKVWREGKEIKASVGPEKVDISHPLAGVMGAANAVTITTDTLGEITIVGPGAGKRETGFSLLVDLLKLEGIK
ncbi:MAG: homoserine dehydrogenase [Candidatus Aminicenantes bacterium]|nr:homoserine dehydrogenase [Candidatus Aminicenantes bacterium]